MKSAVAGRALMVLVVVHLLLTCSLAVVNPHVHVIDDAYYTLTIARNIAQGEGISYGGYPTNGFQPLYAFLMAPVMALLGDHPDLCLRIALCLMAIFSAGLLVVTFRLAERLVDRPTAVLAGALYVLNANLLTYSFSGLETPLHGFLFWAFVALYLRYRETEDWRVQAGLGLLLGLTAYARFDTVFLFVAVAADLAWRQRRQPLRLVRSMPAVFLPALLLLSPWFIWSKRTFGTFFQSSGSFHHWRGLVRQDLPETLLGSLKFALAKLLSLGLKLPLEGVFGYRMPTGILSRHLLGQSRLQTGFLVELLNQRPAVAIIFLGLVLLALVGLFYFGKRAVGWLKRLRPMAFLLIGLGGAALFYPLYLLNYSMRHFFPYSVGMILVWAVLIRGLAGEDFWRRFSGRILVPVLLAIMLALPGVGRWTRDADPTLARGLVAAIEVNIPAGARVGYTDCGVFGYYVRDRIIVNLDGIINFAAQAAMKNGDIGKYLVDQRIDYVLYLHNFRHEFAAQWGKYIAPRVEPITPVDWIYRIKPEKY